MSLSCSLESALRWIERGSLTSTDFAHANLDASPLGQAGLTRCLASAPGVFFVAFFPAFNPRGSSVEATSLLFGSLFVLEAAAWFAALLWLVSRATPWLHHPRVRRRIKPINGLFLIGFAVRLATERR